MSLGSKLRTVAVMVFAVPFMAVAYAVPASAQSPLVAELEKCQTQNVSAGSNNTPCAAVAKRALQYSGGSFDTAIRNYQRAKGILPATGNVGPRTWASFINDAKGVSSQPVATPKAPSKPAESSCTSQTLRFNQDRMRDKQPCVGEVQRLLKAAGHYPNKVDQQFGRRTANGIANFKSTQGLARNDVVDAPTWRALQSPKALPTGIPASCLKVAKSANKVICQNEAHQRIYAFEAGQKVLEAPARFGGLALDKQGRYRWYRTAMSANRKVVEKYTSTSLGGWGNMNYALRTNWAYAFIHSYTPTSHPNDNGHGCVNVLDAHLARQLYNWADVGTHVYNRSR